MLTGWGLGMRVGRRLAIAGLLFGLAACNAATGPLDALAVRVLNSDALAPDTGQSVRLVGVEAPAAPYRDREDVAGAMKGSEERFAVCDAALQGSALILEIGKSAAELCQVPEATRIQAPGLLCDGRLEVSHPPNLEKLD